MKEKELLTLRKTLFDENLIEELEPAKIRITDEGELSPFSDYYGALLGAEKFFKLKEEYRRFYPQDFEWHYKVTCSHLATNLFVPNYQTQRGKLNDRIRKLLRDEKLLAGAETLERILENSSESRRKIANLRKLGFSSSEKEKLEGEFQGYMKHLIGYGEMLQDFLFALRPQKLNEGSVSELIGKERLLFSSLSDKANYQVLKRRMLEEIANFRRETDGKGEPIKEEQFFYQGKEYYSTKAFVREWNRVIELNKQLEEIKKDPTKKVKKAFKVKRPTVRLPKKAMVLVSAGLIATAGTLYAFPSWRHKLGLPVSQIERVEILYEQGNYDHSLHNLKTADEIPEKVAAFWEGKIKLTQYRRRIDSQGYIQVAYNIAEEMVRDNVSPLIEKGTPEISSKDILKTFFDAGYVKKGANLACVDDYSTPKLAAQSHLCGLFDRPTLEPEEKKLLDIIKENNVDVFYVGVEHTAEVERVVFLALVDGKAKDIEYILQKKGKIFEVTDLEAP